MWEGQFLLCWFFYPSKHTANTFTFTRHLFFAIISEYVHSQIQSICKYCVSYINNHIDDFWRKSKYKRICKNTVIYNTPFIVFTYYFGHSLYYLCIFLLYFVSVFHDIWLKYTPFRNGSLVGDLPSLLMDFVFFSLKQKHISECSLLQF